jgi:mono/diheme cytochrome c family protein
MMPAVMQRRALPVLAALAVAIVVAACGTQKYDLKQPGVAMTIDSNATINHGAKLFVERCSGCHNLDAVGAEGGAQKVRDRERTDGPNFNVRHEDVASVLYALRNGGFSGAIMPQDIVVGKDAQAVAEFLAKYAGRGSTNQSTGPNVGGGNQKPTSSGSGGS